jgi:hypothetical protein
LHAVIILVARAVNVHLGRPPVSRRDSSIDEIQSALDALETIGDAVQDDVIKWIA